MRKTLCSKCKHKNLGEDNFCEKCLADLIVLVPNGYYSRWITGVEK